MCLLGIDTKILNYLLPWFTLKLCIVYATIIKQYWNAFNVATKQIAFTVKLLNHWLSEMSLFTLRNIYFITLFWNYTDPRVFGYHCTVFFKTIHDLNKYICLSIHFFHILFILRSFFYNLLILRSFFYNLLISRSFFYILLIPR